MSQLANNGIPSGSLGDRPYPTGRTPQLELTTASSGEPDMCYVEEQHRPCRNQITAKQKDNSESIPAGSGVPVDDIHEPIPNRNTVSLYSGKGGKRTEMKEEEGSGVKTITR